MLKRALSYAHAAVWRRSHSLSTAAAPAAVEPLEGSYVWFPGHMARALRIMKAQMRTVNMIVEVRDARIPRSGINPVFEELVAARRDGTLQRIVVYNKIDLAGGSISKHVDPAAPPYFAADSLNPLHVKRVYAAIRRIQRRQPAEQQYMKVLVVGLPNVGKSTLLNGLRRIGVSKGSAARTGAAAGVTRSIPNMVKIAEEPPIYIVDSPGVMVTGGAACDQETKLKIALTGGMRDDVDANGAAMCHYLFHKLRDRGLLARFCERMRLPGDEVLAPDAVLDLLSRRLGYFLPRGDLDTNRTVMWTLQQYRQGKLGKFVLD